MALDNAQFMSELSITDPPGTDPLSEGDDQIRTSKRTQLQSFPNVDKAVTTTADELNDVATQSGNNVFSGPSNQFNLTTLRFKATLADDEAGALWIGTAGTLRWDFKRESDNSGGDLVLNRYDNNGTLQSTPFVIRAADGQMISSSGTEARPQYSFQSNTDMGMYRLSANIIGFAVLGAERFRIASNAISTFASNMRITVSDTSAGSAKIEMGVLGDNSGFYQARNALGVVSTVLRTDQSDASSYINAGSLDRARLGVGTSSPVATLHVAGPGGLTSTLRVTGLPTSSAGLVSGDCWINPTAQGFVAIIP